MTKRTLFLWLAVLGVGFLGAGNRVANLGTASSLVSFTDDFNRADSTSLGSNYTEVAQDTKVLSNTLTNVTGSVMSVVKRNDALSTVTQYAKLTDTSNADPNGSCGFNLRYTDGTSPCYWVAPDRSAGKFVWYHQTKGDHTGTYTLIQDVATTFASSDSFGVVVVGTGNSTEVRIWLNPTGAAPTSASSWGGASPTHTFTNNPGSPVDSGAYICIAFYSGAAEGNLIDNVSGGDVL